MTDPVNHGKAWSHDDNEKLKAMFNQGLSPEVMAEQLGRKANSVISRLEQWNLLLRVGPKYYKVEADPWWDYRNVKG